MIFFAWNGKSEQTEMLRWHVAPAPMKYSIFTPIPWGDDPIWQDLFSEWVGSTTNERFVAWNDDSIFTNAFSKLRDPHSTLWCNYQRTSNEHSIKHHFLKLQPNPQTPSLQQKKQPERKTKTGGAVFLPHELSMPPPNWPPQRYPVISTSEQWKKTLVG